VLSGLPNSFKFTISAINFQGTFSVYPEDAEIAVGQTVPFTFTFTGANAGSFMQEIRVDCWQPLTNGFSQYNSIRFPMVMRNADVGLVAVVPQDTFVLPKGTATSHVFNVKLINTGISPATVIFGQDSASAGTTAGFGSITNPVAAKDSALLAITLSGDRTHEYYTLDFWAQIQGDSLTRSLHRLVLRMQDSVGVIQLAKVKVIRELGMRNIGNGRLELQVPQNESPTLRLFTITGQMILSEKLKPGTSILDMRAQRLPGGFYILRLQGKKVLQQKILVSGKR
jgi:hypothetical protein